MKYRAEIDGLRALAVVPVILFHAGFELFSGGFVGVDVFFVISGYLITTILIEEIESNRFSIVNFLERRARRILPALFLVMIACIPFAWAWMLPKQMKDFCQSLVAVSLFASNFLFWRESGYFESASEEKPLLHTWSLTVEEQFYILFPSFLLFFFRGFGKSKTFWMIVILASGSLILSEWGWRYQATANFYLAPTRAWELFAGSISAFIVHKRNVQASNTLSVLGLIAIIFSIFAYDDNTPFPSIYSLVPVIGVVMLVLYAEKETFVAKLLSMKAFVAIGLISYSAYLWHQPIFAFARIKLADEPSLSFMSLLTVATTILAYLSWRFIEQPFRKTTNRYTSKVAIFTLALSGIFIFVVAGIIGHKTGGYAAQRFSGQELMFLDTAKSSPLRSKCHFPQNQKSLARTECQYFGNGPQVAVLGNSHATEMAYSLAKILRQKKLSVSHHSMSGCRHNFKVQGEEKTICQRWHNTVMEKIISNSDIKTVVLSYRNENYLHEEQYRNSLVEIADTLLNSNKRVILVLQAPLPGAHIEKYLAKNLEGLPLKVSGLSVNDWRQTYQAIRHLEKEINEEVIVVNPMNYFCDSRQCFVILNGKALYFDGNHMSIYGAKLIAEGVAEIIGHK